MRPKRKSMGGGAVAFIDVMACGLGAVVLLLVIVDFNIVEIITPRVEPTPVRATELPQPSMTELQARLELLQSKNVVLADSVANLTAAVLEQKITGDALRVSVEKPESPPVTDPISNKSGQLIGLKVNGRSIIILLDKSGSMYSDILAENVLYAVAPSKMKSDQSAKWAQGKRIAQWIVDVAPENANLKLATFAESVSEVSNGWQKKASLSASAASSLDKIVPQSGTDLHSTFAWLTKNSVRNAQVFLITDGLPTKISSQGFVSRMFSTCARDPKGFVSGQCRQQIFTKSAALLASADVELNVILLPSEGDPMAAPQYWALAKSKGGLLFSPELNWP
jgi:hypothetical protein